MFLPGCKVWTKSSPHSRPVIIRRVSSCQKGLHLDLNWGCMLSRDNKMLTECFAVGKHHVYVFWFCLTHEPQDDDQVGGIRKGCDCACRLLFLKTMTLSPLRMIITVSHSYCSVFLLACRYFLIHETLLNARKHFLSVWCKAVMECFVFSRDLEMLFLHLSWL